MNCLGSRSLCLYLFINLIVCSDKLIPLRCVFILINDCPVLLKQQDRSLDDTPNQKAGLEVLGGINPVTN